MEKISPYKKLKRDMGPHNKNYITKDASIGLPKAWFKDCIDKELRKTLTDMSARISRIEAKMAKSHIT